MWRADSLEKALMLGKIEGKRRWDDRGWKGWMASSTQWTWVWVDSGSWWWTGRPGVLRFMGSKESDTTEQLNWTQSKSLAQSEAEADIFLVFLCFFNDPADVGNSISGSSAFSKSSLNIWKFMVHVLLKPGLENFEHYFASVWDKWNCAVVWTFFGIAFLWDWNENCFCPILWQLLSFPDLLAYWVQPFHSIIF